MRQNPQNTLAKNGSFVSFEDIRAGCQRRAGHQGRPAAVFRLGLWPLAATGAQAQTYGTYGTGSNPNSHPVQDHTNGNGTYVQPYVATNPNGTQRDSYSATGNVNPYTGAVGTRSPRY
jgi:hypothetical protein